MPHLEITTYKHKKDNKNKPNNLNTSIKSAMKLIANS